MKLEERESNAIITFPFKLSIVYIANEIYTLDNVIGIYYDGIFLKLRNHSIVIQNIFCIFASFSIGMKMIQR